MRRLLTLLALIFCISAMPVQASFSDVPKDDPHAIALLFLQTLGVVEGYPDNSFRTEQSMTRAEFAKLLVAGMDLRLDSTLYKDCFSDVHQEWYAASVCYLKKEGIVRGIDANRFAPAEKVTRAEATKMVIIAFGLQKDLPRVTTSIYMDVAPEDWFSGYMQRARFMNLLPASDFAFPNRSINRGDASELLFRAMMSRILKTPSFSPEKAEIFMREQMHLMTSPAEAPQLDDEEAQQQLDIYKDVIDQLRVLHPNGSAIPLSDYIYASMEGLAKEVGDPYTVFLRPDASKQFTDSLNGDLEGIGVEISEDPFGALIMNVFPDSPAEKGGLKAGDIVTRAADIDLGGKTTEEIVTLMRGKEGTTVTIDFLRSGEKQTVTLTRAKLHIPSVLLEMEDRVAVIRVTQFGGSTADELKAVLTSLPQDTQAIVLDLRNNGGGYIDISQDIAGFFLPKNSLVVSLKDALGNEDSLYTLNEPLTALPMAVLVNGYSASAAEVMAGTLRDHKRAQLVGEPTFGKGTVQSLVRYVDGSTLRITMAQWFTPNGDSVGDVAGNHHGLQPEIRATDDPATPADEQLDAATALFQ